MRIRVVAIGKDRKGLFGPAAEEYAARVGRQMPFELVVAGDAQGDGEVARRAEAALLRRALRPRDLIVALDERGQELTSEGLAGKLQEAERAGGRDLAFVLGGPSGLDAAFRAEAAWTLALSRMTLPHQLARVVLLEQLYRALTLLRGEPYHK